MKRLLLPLLLAVLFTPVAARAQGLGFEIAGAMGRDFHDDAWLAAGHLRIPLGRRVEFRPSGAVELRSGSPWDLNADLALRGPRGIGYLGAGAGLFERPRTGGPVQKVGANLFLGFSGVGPGLRPFLEFRWTRVDGATLFRPMLGLRLGF